MTAITKTAKVENYSVESTEKLVAAYSDGASVADLATMFGKTTRSIVAKLSREKVYIKPEHVRKDGTKVERKNDTATAIGLILNLSENDVDSLTKATRSALQSIFSALANSKPV